MKTKSWKVTHPIFQGVPNRGNLMDEIRKKGGLIGAHLNRVSLSNKKKDDPEGDDLMNALMSGLQVKVKIRFYQLKINLYFALENKLCKTR